jgi:hypothetical protein
MMEIEAENSIKKDIVNYIIVLLLAVGIGYAVSIYGIALGTTLLALPFAIALIIMIFRNPKIGLLVTLNYSFFSNGLQRYTSPDIPFGLGVDIILLISLIAALFKSNKGSINSWVFYMSLIWFSYTLIELVNPEATSKEAWFYSGRGVSLYQIMVIPITLMWANKKKDLDGFIKIWITWSLIAALYAFKMNYLGLTEGEQKWLDDGGKITHFIQGRLRIFSFFSDAGQFGAAMAEACLFCLLMAVGPYEKKVKIRYAIIAAITFWGYALSGSRGPLFVLASGGFLYLFLIRNFKVLVIGVTIGFLAFAFLKFTTIGNTNYQIYRMRTALDPNDASLQVRLNNQKLLRTYLKTRPLGGGIGSGAGFGERFYPGRFLSGVALDSWYVKIWVETGIIGLVIHIIHIIIVLIVGVVNCFKIKNPDIRQKMMGIVCGYFGILCASYGNQIFGQFPTGPIMYMSMVYMFICVRWDKEISETNVKEVAK